MTEFPDIEFEVVSSASMPRAVREQVVSLCNLAYQEDLSPLFATFGLSTHILGRSGPDLVSHAMWVISS